MKFLFALGTILFSLSSHSQLEQEKLIENWENGTYTYYTYDDRKKSSTQDEVLDVLIVKKGSKTLISVDRNYYFPKKRAHNNEITTDVVRYFEHSRERNKKLIAADGKLIFFEGDPDGDYTIVGSLNAEINTKDISAMSEFFTSSSPNKQEALESMDQFMKGDIIIDNSEKPLHDGKPLEGQYDVISKWKSGDYTYYSFKRNYNYDTQKTEEIVNDEGKQNLRMYVYNGQTVSALLENKSRFVAKPLKYSGYAIYFQNPKNTSEVLYFMEDKILVIKYAFESYHAYPQYELLGALGGKPNYEDFETFKKFVNDAVDKGQNLVADNLTIALKDAMQDKTKPNKITDKLPASSNTGISISKNFVEHNHIIKYQTAIDKSFGTEYYSKRTRYDISEFEFQGNHLLVYGDLDHDEDFANNQGKNSVKIATVSQFADYTSTSKPYSLLGKNNGFYKSGAFVSPNQFACAQGGKVDFLDKKANSNDYEYTSFYTITDGEIEKIIKLNDSLFAAVYWSEDNDNMHSNINLRKQLKLLIANPASDYKIKLTITDNVVSDDITIKLHNDKLICAFNEYFGTKSSALAYATVLLEIDPLKSWDTDKLVLTKSLHFDNLNNYILSDFILDNDNIVAVFCSGPRYSSNFSDDNKSEFYYRNMCIVSLNKSWTNYKINELSTVPKNLWGRSNGAKYLKMKYQDEIRFSDYGKPQLTIGKKGNYIVANRFSWGLWQYATNYDANATDNNRSDMYGDQPCFLSFDKNNLDLLSWDFIETTYKIGQGHDPAKFNLKNSLGRHYQIQQFEYWPEKDIFLLLERGRGYDSHLWSIDIAHNTGFSGVDVTSIDKFDAPAESNKNKDNEIASNDSDDESNEDENNNTSNNNQPSYSGSFTVINDTDTKYHVWFKNGGGWIPVRGSKTTRCEKGQKVYVATTSSSGDKKLILEIKPEHCGQRIKLSEFL